MEFKHQKKHQRKAFPFSHRTYSVIWSRGMDGNDFNLETPAFLCYTRMLRMAFNVPWKDKVRNEDLYGRLPSASSKVASRRLKLAGHCVRHPEVASKLVLWEPSQGRMNVGRRAVTYVDVVELLNKGVDTLLSEFQT